MIWLRKSFDVVEGSVEETPLRLLYKTRGNATVYLNGVRVGTIRTRGPVAYDNWVDRRPDGLSQEARLRPGTNVIAVEAMVGQWGAFLDLGLYRRLGITEMSEVLAAGPDSAHRAGSSP